MKLCLLMKLTYQIYLEAGRPQLVSQGNGFKSHLFSIKNDKTNNIGDWHGTFMDVEKISSRNSRGQLKKELEFPGLIKKILCQISTQ